MKIITANRRAAKPPSRAHAGKPMKEMLHSRGISDEETLERIERQLEERQQEYDAEGFHLWLRDAGKRSR